LALNWKTFLVQQNFGNSLIQGLVIFKKIPFTFGRKKLPEKCLNYTIYPFTDLDLKIFGEEANKDLLISFLN